MSPVGYIFLSRLTDNMAFELIRVLRSLFLQKDTVDSDDNQLGGSICMWYSLFHLRLYNSAFPAFDVIKHLKQVTLGSETTLAAPHLLNGNYRLHGLPLYLSLLLVSETPFHSSGSLSLDPYTTN